MRRYVSFVCSIAGLHVVWRAKVIREVAVEHGADVTDAKRGCQCAPREFTSKQPRRTLTDPLAIPVGKATQPSTFGAAASFAALLLWLYYSAQIFLLGAELTAVLGGTRVDNKK